MERRQHPRKSANFFASINYPPLGLLQARVHNLSNNGAFIHSGTIRLNLNCDVEFVNCIDNHLTTVRARVVRITPDGAGLYFVNTNPKAMRRIQSHLTVIDAKNDFRKVRRAY